MYQVHPWQDRLDPGGERWCKIVSICPELGSQVSVGVWFVKWSCLVDGLEIPMWHALADDMSESQKDEGARGAPGWTGSAVITRRTSLMDPKADPATSTWKRPCQGEYMWTSIVYWCSITIKLLMINILSIYSWCSAYEWSIGGMVLQVVRSYAQQWIYGWCDDCVDLGKVYGHREAIPLFLPKWCKHSMAAAHFWPMYRR